MEKQQTVKGVLDEVAARTRAKLPSYERIIEALESDESMGFCLACGADAYGVEPDMRAGECDECGAAKVYGAEECLILTVA
jgi:hypothetical protein